VSEFAQFLRSLREVVLEFKWVKFERTGVLDEVWAQPQPPTVLTNVEVPDRFQ